MTPPKIYMTRKIPERGLEKIKQNFNVEVWPNDDSPPKHVILEKAANVDGLVTLLSDPIDAEVFSVADDLQIISQYAVGFDNISIKEATKQGVYVTNTPGVLSETTADFAWALLMAVARKVVEADEYVRKGEWTVAWHPKMLLGKDVYGSTLGIIGLGRIGSAMAKRAQGFDMDVLYYSRSRKQKLEQKIDLEYTQLEDLLRRSDFVSLHVPLTDETYHLIDEEALQLMKETAILVNNARGDVINEKALYTGLKEGWIAGAGLDVFEQEPTSKDNPLLSLDNVVVAPHISSASYKTRSKMAEIVAQNLISFFEGETPPNLVNPEVVKKKPTE